MFNIILRISILCLVEYISFELMIPDNFNFHHIKSFFIFWIIIHLFLMFKGAADFSAFSAICMQQPQTHNTSEFTERAPSPYRYRIQKFNNLKFDNKHIVYAFCIFLTLILYFVFKVFL